MSITIHFCNHNQEESEILFDNLRYVREWISITEHSHTITQYVFISYTEHYDKLFIDEFLQWLKDTDRDYSVYVEQPKN